MSALLEVSDFSVHYGRVEALHEVSLRVEAGRIVTVVGPNGAGKTTLLAALMGLLASRGVARYDGAPLDGMETEDRLEHGLVLVPERRELFGEMSVADNLLLGGYAYRRDRAGQAKRLDAVYQRFPRLAERRGQAASTLSGGERQMLALGRALMSRPRLLMLDEPSLGLAPLMVAEIFAIIAGLRALGVAVLLVEQNARAALEAADDAYVLETGEVTLSGPAATLRDDPRVRGTYLGGE